MDPGPPPPYQPPPPPGGYRPPYPGPYAGPYPPGPYPPSYPPGPYPPPGYAQPPQGQTTSGFAIAALVFGAFGGFADGAKVENGFLSLPQLPGIGFEGQSALYAIMRELAG